MNRETNGLWEPDAYDVKANEKPSVDGQRILLFSSKSTKQQIISLIKILFKPMTTIHVLSCLSCSHNAISDNVRQKLLEGGSPGVADWPEGFRDVQ